MVSEWQRRPRLLPILFASAPETSALYCKKLRRITSPKATSDYIQGSARPDSDGTVLVSGENGSHRKLRAKAILIATGSRPFRPENISFDIPGVCDTDTILHRGRVPKDIIIVGGGAVGVEFATICPVLGAKVTVLDRASRLMTMMDAEVSAIMEELFIRWGVQILFGSSIENVAQKGNGLEVRLTTGETLRPDTLLFAAGRVANTQDLGLEAAV